MDMSPRPKLADQHPDLQTAIKDAAWKQIADEGAAALSLRAIARALGITAPAIYNYFPRRDDLVTALIVEAFNSLGDAQYQALDGLPDDDHKRRLAALGRAYRNWATTYPQRYLLIFGTPIPGYEAPEEITLPAAARSLTPLIQTLQAALIAGQLHTSQLALASPALKEMLVDWAGFTGEGAPEVHYLALVIWSRVHGLAMLEIGNQMPTFINDPGEVFNRELETLLVQTLLD
jgi:AcrR family transcriptional regulator